MDAQTLEKHLINLENIIKSTGAVLEGNCFYYHQSFTKFPELFNKQCNLASLGEQAKKICEIGFNAGHSALLLLGGRNVKEILFFDLGEHKYMKPCYEYIQKAFLGTEMDFVVGDSRISLPKWLAEHPEESETFDLVHVDGGHLEDIYKSDIEVAKKMVKKGGCIIIDDTNIDYISKDVDEILKTNLFEEVNVLQTVGYQHRVIRKV